MTIGYDQWTFVGPDAWRKASSVFNNRLNITEFADAGGPTNAWDCQIPGGGRGNLTTFTYPHGPGAGGNENDSIGYVDLFSSGSCP